MEDISTYYGEKSENYDFIFDALYFRVYDAVTWKYLEPHVPTVPDAVVLDAGGGTARWAIRMAEKGCRVVLLVSSEKMLIAAAQKVEKKGLQSQITLQKGDIAATGYADESFDMVFCEHALFLFKEPDVAIQAGWDFGNFCTKPLRSSSIFTYRQTTRGQCATRVQSLSQPRT